MRGMGPASQIEYAAITRVTVPYERIHLFASESTTCEKCEGNKLWQVMCEPHRHLIYT